MSGNLLAHGVQNLARQVEADARAKAPQALDVAIELALEVEALLAALSARVGEAAAAPEASAARG